jgi:hypothetical protein
VNRNWDCLIINPLMVMEHLFPTLIFAMYNPRHTQREPHITVPNVSETFVENTSHFILGSEFMLASSMLVLV